MQIKAGTVLVIETGEYSDYCFTGPFRVLKAFDQADVAEKYRSQWKPQESSWRIVEDGPDADDFIPWLAREGYIEDIEGVVSWHVGSYGNFDPSIQNEKPDLDLSSKPVMAKLSPPKA